MSIESTPIDRVQQANRDGRAPWIALVVLCVGVLMIVLDQTIVNVALPSIQDDLGFTQSNLAWVVNAYLIAFGGLLLLAGRLGDLLGQRRVFMAGLAVFVAASAACGLSQSQGILVAARFIQGAGGAMTSAVVLGMIVTMFPEPREQAKAIGVYSFVAAAGASIGLLLGGVITQAVNWHWIFFVNLPIGIATALLTLRVVPGDRSAVRRGGADIPGAAFLVSALMLGVYTIVETSRYGWGSAHTVGFGAAALALLAAFVLREARAKSPLVPLRVFRMRNSAGANVVVSLMVAGFFGMFFLGAIYMQKVLGYDALEVGLAFLPVAALIGGLSLGVSARLNTRYGARATLLPGLVLVLIGLLWFARCPTDASYVADLLPTMIVLGVGAGLCFPSLMTLAMSSATPSESGLASGLVNTTTQVGGALGLAVVVTLSSTRTKDLLAAGHSPASALTSGFHLAFLVGAGLVAVAIAVAALVLEPVRAPSEAVAEPPPRRPHAEPVSETA
jgi:EmrB/QacA subfamily drug resistance transporter